MLDKIFIYTIALIGISIIVVGLYNLTRLIFDLFQERRIRKWIVYYNFTLTNGKNGNGHFGWTTRDRESIDLKACKKYIENQPFDNPEFELESYAITNIQELT